MSERAKALRASFDASFATLPEAVPPRAEMIQIAVTGGATYLLPLARLAGIQVDRRIVAVPTATPALLGLASFRGALAPVYDLSLLLGHAPCRSPRWIALARQTALVGFAFESFEGQLRVPLAEASKNAIAGPRGPIAIVDVPSLFAHVSALSPPRSPAR